MAALAKAGWSGRGGCHRQHLRASTLLGARRDRGAQAQAIGPSRGGQTIKVHSLTDVLGRPGVLLLTPGMSTVSTPETD